MLSEPDFNAAEIMDLLAAIERRSAHSKSALPETALEQGFWQGLVFSVAGERLVAPMDEITEMLPRLDAVTRVPGAKKWVVGLGNVRGNLLPVIDLQLFLGAQPVVPMKSTRILVVRGDLMTTGLLVPGVHGMRHFDVDARISVAGPEGPVGRYVSEAFTDGDETWPVFSVSALAADPEFQLAAA